MSKKSDSDPNLSLAEATATINKFARNPATRILPIRHCHERQSERLISFAECVNTLKFGEVTAKRHAEFNGKMTIRYAVEFSDEFSRTRVVVRIKSERLLILITAIDLGPTK